MASPVLQMTAGCRGAVWPNDHSAAREGPGTEVLFTLGGCGVRRLAEEIPLLVFQFSAVARPRLNLLVLRTSLPFCRNL